MEGDDKYPATPLASHERQAVRGVLAHRERSQWLKGQLKYWGLWVLGVPAAALTFLKAIQDLFGSFLGPMR